MATHKRLQTVQTILKHGRATLRRRTFARNACLTVRLALECCWADALYTRSDIGHQSAFSCAADGDVLMRFA